jgi:hemerythrin
MGEVERDPPDWSDDLAVGVPEMDDQHRRLVLMFRRFSESLVGGKHTKCSLNDLVCGLLDYTRYHFTTEERLMRESGYPDAEAHRQRHQAFVDWATGLAGRFSRGQKVESGEAIGFLSAWVADHIKVLDRELGEHVRSQYGGA